MSFSARLAAFRIDNAGYALLVCSAGSAFFGACAFAIMMAAIDAFGWFALGWFDGMASFVARVFLAFIPALIAIFPAGAAFGIPTAWLARRFRSESLGFYLVTGCIAGAACSLALNSWPDGFSLAVETVFRICGPIFGGSWALLWWLTHRRWQRLAE